MSARQALVRQLRALAADLELDPPALADALAERGLTVEDVADMVLEAVRRTVDVRPQHWEDDPEHLAQLGVMVGLSCFLLGYVMEGPKYG